MRILIADDDDVSRLALYARLKKRGHAVMAVANGVEALQILEGPDRTPLAILDWMMPGMDGIEVCRRLRGRPELRSLYLILLTSRDGKKHLVEGLSAGANDYICKPFDGDELQARVNVGVEMVRLQEELKAHVSDLQQALARVKRLQGLLPICSYCKSVRDDRNYWHQVDEYLQTHADAQLTHGVCPDCWDKKVKPEMARLGIQPAGLADSSRGLAQT